MKQLISNGIERGIFPGAVVCLYREGEPLLLEAYGHRMITPQRLPMGPTTLFDLASLTKPVATATALMILREQGRVYLKENVSTYLPGFTRSGISVFHLLTHTSGLPAWRPLYLEPGSKRKDKRHETSGIRVSGLKSQVSSLKSIVKYLAELPLEYEPGSKVVYSCLGYVLLGELVREVAEMGLDRFTHEQIFEPLDMKDTFFNPPEERRGECAATEDSNSFEKRMTNYRRYNWREGVVVGEVHDENAHFLGGVAGNAGLFSTASDLARFCRMLISGGENILSPESVQMMASLQTRGLNESRGIGWIILPEGTLYHTGFTGTAMWIDLKRRAAAILLTNRVHPDATKEGISEVREKFYMKFKEE
jgi:CubicO group peptidase (beta-lactamase class C family)